MEESVKKDDNHQVIHDNFEEEKEKNAILLHFQKIIVMSLI